MRSEQQIEKKIEKALHSMEQQPRDYEYIRGVREALGWVLEEDDSIPGLDDE